MRWALIRRMFKEVCQDNARPSRAGYTTPDNVYALSVATVEVANIRAVFDVVGNYEALRHALLSTPTIYKLLT